MNEPRVVESVTNECQSLGSAHESSSARAEQLVACLEGEIAKRDEELAACRVSVENCELFRARIVELESRIVWLECEAQVNAAPVSEAKAQVVMPERQDDQYGDQDAIGWNACLDEVARLNAAPVQQVSVDGLDGISERIAKVWIGHAHIDDLITIGKEVDAAQAIIDGLRGEVESGRRSFEIATGSVRALIAERDQQAQRIGELEGLLREVHDTYRAAIHWEDLRGTMKRIDSALSAGKDSVS